MIKAQIADLATNISAKVTSRGELVTGHLSFSKAYNATASVINTGYNAIAPRAGNIFVITDILIYANKDIGVNDASIVIYTANSPTSTTAIESLISAEIKANTARDLTGLNLLVPNGVWVNVKTDDNTVYFTIMGYYVEGSDS